MTERERIAIAEKKIRLLEARGHECEVCGKQINACTTQLAHRVIKSGDNLKKYGKAIIHHDLNLALTCSLYCNGKVIVNGLPKEHLLIEIKEAIEAEQGGRV